LLDEPAVQEASPALRDLVLPRDVDDLDAGPGFLADDGSAFRVVDCKYQYILSIPSLLGAGKYRVEILINNVSVPTPGSPGGMVTFDLK